MSIARNGLRKTFFHHLWRFRWNFMRKFFRETRYPNLQHGYILPPTSCQTCEVVYIKISLFLYLFERLFKSETEAAIKCELMDNHDGMYFYFRTNALSYSYWQRVGPNAGRCGWKCTKLWWAHFIKASPSSWH